MRALPHKLLKRLISMFMPSLFPSDGRRPPHKTSPKGDSFRPLGAISHGEYSSGNG